MPDFRIGNCIKTRLVNFYYTVLNLCYNSHLRVTKQFLNFFTVYHLADINYHYSVVDDC